MSEFVWGPGWRDYKETWGNLGGQWIFCLFDCEGS